MIICNKHVAFMATESLSQFLCEVFCVYDVNEIDNLAHIFDISNSCLNYNSLLMHPRVVAVGMCTQLFFNTFGYMPSFAHVYELMQGQKHWDIQSASNKMLNMTFLRYARPDTMLAKAFERAKHGITATQYAFSNHRARAKGIVWRWMARGQPPSIANIELDNESTLLSTFTKNMLIIRKPTALASRSINNIESISRDHLSWTDIVAVCPYQYDALSQHITMNMNYYRNFFGRIVIFVPHTSATTYQSNTLAKAIACILGSYTKDRVVIVAPNDVVPGIKEHKAVAKHQVTYIPCNDDTIIPHNIAAVCYIIGACGEYNRWNLGATPLRKVVIDPPPMSSKPANDTIIMCTTNNNARQAVHVMLPSPCIPLYAPDAIAQAYFSMRIELDGCENKLPDPTKDSIAGRIGIYAALAYHIPPTLTLQTNSHKHKNAIVLVDTRPNPLSLLSILVTWSNVDQSQWDIVIGTSSQSLPFYKEHIPQAHFFMDDSLEVSPFDIDAYNDLLKSSRLWEYLVGQGYEKCMIIQDDGMLVRKGLEKSEFLTQYTLVGAPWLQCQGNREVYLLTDGRMIGNGGFCIRDPHNMLKISTQHSRNTTTLFNSCLQPIQEDVFYAKFAASTPSSIELASSFSTEQVFNSNSFGFHKLWMYHPLERTLEFARNIPMYM